RCHRCPHLLTRPYEQSEKPCALSEYMQKYPLHPGTLPRESFKPKADYKMAEIPMEGTSVTKRDYITYEVLSQELKEPKKYVKSDESMDLTSVYRQDYNSYPTCRVPPCLPCETREISNAKMNTKSTYNDDYLLWNEPKRELIRQDDEYHLSESKFDHRTVVQDDYSFRGPVFTHSIKPPNLIQKSKAPFENKTNYRVNYVLHPLEKRYIHQYEKYKPSEVPFNGLTTNKISYKGLACKPPKLAKPYQSKSLHDLPFSSSTEFQEKYKPWPQPPIFTKKPAEYVPPAEKMDLHTTTQLHYKCLNVKPAKMCLPLDQHKKTTERFNGSSTMKEDYKPWVCKRVKPITHNPELTFPAKPMDYLTTFQTHYQPHPPMLTKSYKPPWPGPRPHIPVGAKTTYATSYTPKGAVRCSASYKNPPGYIFEGTSADGHKFYVPASEECLQGCY
ncbi:SAXO1 protein, partial [Odontophorus gujanensis]|nr:SAXO1 protein [Odontophorus gujanensis]